MNEKPLVSIITPCYNMEMVIFRLLDSIIAQTYRPIEFILIDDGSTDHSLNIAKNYKNKFDVANIDYILIHQENKGLAGAINTGLKNMHGDYFCWPDADDFLEPTSIEERVKAFLDHPECGVVTSNAYVRDSSNLNVIISTISDDSKFYEPKQFLYHLNGDSIFCTGCHMANTDKFKEVVPEMQIFPARRGQNWQLLLPLYYVYDRFFLNKPLYNYINYPNSMSRDRNTYEDISFRYSEHKIILKETLFQIERVQNVDMHEFFSFVENKYAKLLMEVAIQYRNKKAFDEEYAKKQRLVGLDRWDRLALIRSKASILDNLICGYYRLRRKNLRLEPEKVVNYASIREGIVQRDIKVSVLIPCYNAEEYIENCMRCLLEQSHKNLEIILVNDGSTDQSDVIIQKFIPEFFAQGMVFKYIKQDNAGAAAAVDVALQHVTGKYMMLYDTDDILYRDAVYAKVNYMEKNVDCNMVVNNGYYVTEPFELGRNFFYYEAPNTESFFDGLLEGKYVNWPGSYMIRTEEFKKHLPEHGHIYTSQFGQNLQFMLPMAYKNKVGYIEKPLMNYYVRSDSHSHYGGVERTLERAQGYTTNRIEILNSMRMEPKVRQDYIDSIQKRVTNEMEEIENAHSESFVKSFFNRANDKCKRIVNGAILERKLRKNFYESNR